MKNFSGVILSEINLEDLNELMRVREIFAENYSQKFMPITELCNPQKVIKHLENFLKLISTPTRNLNQKVALALKYLPENSSRNQQTYDDNVIAVLKATLPDMNCDNNDILALSKKISLDKISFNRLMYFEGEEFDLIFNKRLAEHNVIIPLHYKRDWKKSVDDIYATVCRKNLNMAFEMLREIMDLPRTKKFIIKPEDMQYAISLQIIYYIDILAFIFSVIKKGTFFFTAREVDMLDMCRFGDVVKRELQFSLKQLMTQPEPGVARSNRKFTPRMLFACMPHKTAEQVFPEQLLQPLFLTRNSS